MERNLNEKFTIKQHVFIYINYDIGSERDRRKKSTNNEIPPVRFVMMSINVLLMKSNDLIKFSLFTQISQFSFLSFARESCRKFFSILFHLLQTQTIENKLQRFLDMQKCFAQLFIPSVIFMVMIIIIVEQETNKRNGKIIALYYIIRTSIWLWRRRQ